MRKTVLFIDNTYRQPYKLSTLKQQALGGTEASIIKTAEILSIAYKVLVAQKYRDEDSVENENLKFISKRNIGKYQPDWIIVVRKYQLLKPLSKEFPSAKLFLWIHTYKNIEYVLKKGGLCKRRVTLICNSNTHKESIDKILNQSFISKIFNLLFCKNDIVYCYNPVGRGSQLNEIRDNNKLLFFSSPNKGLAQVIDTFNAISVSIPGLKLYIANPGYKRDENRVHQDNIIVLGSLQQSELRKHIAQSLCVFYPQNSFAETFGLIYAEANSLGTPVMAHDIGAAREILDDNNPLVDAQDRQQVLNMIKKWQQELPNVSYNEKFSSEYILNQWQVILSNS